MVQAIVKKEWLKIRFAFYTILFISITALIHFAYNIHFSFITVEPETMMWYRFTSLEQKPYYYFSYLFFLIALCISAFQFVPERIKNRIKILPHLPISMPKSIFLHLFIGILYIFVLNFFIAIGLVGILINYYPEMILYIIIQDLGFYFLGSVLLYLGVSSAVIDMKPIIGGIKFFVTLLLLFTFIKPVFTLLDFVWILLLGVMLFEVLDSFYSVKEQRFNNVLFKSSRVLSLGVVIVLCYNQYTEKYAHTFNKYYIFYSPIKKAFVYQKNFGDHRFEYGIKDKETFDMKTYQSLLPFVYWRDLDIQNKLPIMIDDRLYDKNQIKKSRLSFSYNPKLVKKQEVLMYPLINPNSKVGMIKFPEEMIALKNDSIEILDYDYGLSEALTKELKSLLTSNNVQFPIKNIWGKSTNMKPFDLGYFIKDANNRLFKLNRADDKLSFKEVSYPKNSELMYMKISENRQQKLAGYAITKDNTFYIIDYKSLEFKKIALSNFDYRTMKLQFISNPKYYLIRYNNGDTYYASVFDKNLNNIDNEVFE